MCEIERDGIGDAYEDGTSTIAVPLDNPSGTGDAVASASSSTADSFADVCIFYLLILFLIYGVFRCD